MLPKGRCSKSRCAGKLGMKVNAFEIDVQTYLFNEGLVMVSSQGTEITDKGKKYIEGE